MVRAAAEAADKIASVFNMTVEFAVHEETGFEMLQIIDSRTNVVIREMPPHEILDMIANGRPSALSSTRQPDPGSRLGS